MSHVEEFLSQFALEIPEGTPEEIARHYQFVSCLSRKETREVYLLRHRETNEKSVLKRCGASDPEDLARVFHILSGLSQPAHPGIPALQGFWQQGEYRFLLRAWAEGETLDALVARDGVFPQRRVLEIALALCDILPFLHRQDPPVVFRDIKPQNIVLTANGKLSLIDFGTIKELTPEEDGQTDHIGSAAFAAPEQYGFSKTSPQTDIFAIGKLMLWLAGGNRDTVPTGSFGCTIRKCTELSQRLRFRSVGALARQLRRLLNPPKPWEMALGFAAFAVVFAAGVLWASGLFAPPEEISTTDTPVIVGGAYEKEAAFPVSVQVLENGVPTADCVISIDNRHWYYPTNEGDAQLWTHAYDFYTLRAASENRVAEQPLSVNRGSSLDFTLELDKVPVSEPFLRLSLPEGEPLAHWLELPNAREVALQGQPEEVSLVDNDGEIILTAENLPVGFYAFFLEAKNEYGTSTTAVSLLVTDIREAVPIASAEQLHAIRNNLAGHYELTADINLSAYSSWEPIGTPEQPFTGVLNGNGYRVTGLSIDTDAAHIGLFGVTKGAVLQQIILEEPAVRADNGDYSNIGALAGVTQSCLVERCAVLGGNVEAVVASESNIGGLCGYGYGVFLACFSSVTVNNHFPQDGAQTYVGGICGVLMGYLADCGNAEEVSGVYVTGGLVGMNDNGVITRSYNTGPVRGALLNGQIPPGGIAHIMRVGRYVSHCAFAETAAEVGVTTTTDGYPIGLHAVTEESFHSPEELAAMRLSESLSFAMLDSRAPIPAGIFRETAPPPIIERREGRITVAPQDGVLYFHTLDGSNPRLLETGVESLDLRLENGERLQIFAARRGCYDSELLVTES